MSEEIKLPFDKFQAGVSLCKEILEALAEERKKTPFTNLKKKLSKQLNIRYTHTEFEIVLAHVNRDSWTQHRIILTAIVPCRGGVPGSRFWYQAKELGAILFYPEEDDWGLRRSLARQLSEAVYNHYSRLKQIKTIDLRNSKAPALF